MIGKRSGAGICEAFRNGGQSEIDVIRKRLVGRKPMLRLDLLRAMPTCPMKLNGSIKDAGPIHLRPIWRTSREGLGFERLWSELHMSRFL